MARENRLIQFYLTNKCNSKCKTCGIWKEKEKRELPLDAVKRVILQNPKADFVFGGGEVTLYSNLSELCRFCNNNNINYTCLTNCVNLYNAMALVERYHVKNITVSYDGILHDQIRGVSGNTNNIRTFFGLYGNKVDTLKVSYTYSKYNEDYVYRDFEYIRAYLGVHEIYFCLANDLEILNAGTGNAVNLSSIKKVLNADNVFKVLTDRDRMFLKNLNNGIKHQCDSVDSVFTVDVDGNVVVCQAQLSNVIRGNICDGTKTFNEIVADECLCNGCKYDSQCNQMCQRRYDL